MVNKYWLFYPKFTNMTVFVPLAKVDDIVFLDVADRTTSEFTKLIGQLPPAQQVLLYRH